MFKRIRQRLDGNNEQGFTLIELLVVIIIIGILLAIAVPSYLGFRDRANDSAAKANVRAALPAVEAYYADNGDYDGMTAANLRSGYDQNIKLTTVTETDTAYCVHSDVNGKDWKVIGGNAVGASTDPVAGTC
jgi:type IV pilus assembly protein PilA